MKKVFIISFMLFVVQDMLCQPGWDWATNGTGPQHQLAQCIAHDAVGNSYVCGMFHDSATFDWIHLYGDGFWSAFIAKYDPYGNLVWAQSPQGSGNLSEEAKAITVSIDGSIYVTGMFSDPSITFGAFTLTGTGAEIYLVKMDAYGTVLWARSAGGSDTETPTSVRTDNNGDVYICGNYESPVCTFGTLSISPVNSTNPDAFLAKYDANGNALWAKTAGGTLWDGSANFDFDASGNIYLLGIFKGTAMNAGSYVLSGTNGSYEVFVIKYNLSGNEMWARAFGGISDDLPVSLKINSANQLVLTGMFGNGALDFDGDTLYPAGGNLFIVKLDSMGNTMWALNEGSSIPWSVFVYVHGLDIDGNDNIYVVGDITGPVEFSGDTILNADATGQTSDIFVAKYDSAGSLIWIKREGSSNVDACQAISVKDDDNFTIAGVYFNAAIHFDSDTLLPTGMEDFYIAQAGSGLTAINLQAENLWINLFPNPTAENVTAIVDADLGLVDARIALFDLSGREILLQAVNPGANVILCSNLSPGVYFYRFTNNGEIAGTGKLIVE